MNDINKAYNIVIKHNPNMKCYTCNELEKFYAFSLVPKDLAKGDAFANSHVYLIDKKTFEYKSVHFLKIMNEPIIKEIDPFIFN